MGTVERQKRVKRFRRAMIASGYRKGNTRRLLLFGERVTVIREMARKVKKGGIAFE